MVGRTIFSFANANGVEYFELIETSLMGDPWK